VAAEALMVDTVVITHQTADPTNADTGVITPTTTTLYTGKAKVQHTAVPSGSPRDLGEASVIIMRTQIHVPISVTGIVSDDVVTVTASRDPDLVGRRFVVRAVAAKSYLTARRLDVEQRSS
jgi:phosphate/sulfate permease